MSKGSTKLRLKKKKESKTIIDVLDVPAPIIIDGIDVTPKPLDIFDRRSQPTSNTYDLAKDSIIFGSAIDLLNETKRINLTTSGPAISYNEQLSLESIYSTRSSSESEQLSRKQSAIIDEKMKKIPETIKLLLQETETIFLLDLPSCTVTADTDDCKIVEEDNDNYEFLTIGKGRNRKVATVETQTLPILMKTRKTQTSHTKMRNVGEFVANWVMYDDYLQFDQEFDEKSIKLNQTVTFGSSTTFGASVSEERYFAKLVNNQRFQDVVCVIERLLANNCYNKEQKRLKGLLKQDEFRDNIEYKYRLNLLWNYTNEDVYGNAVVGIALNPDNDDIIAVGYGKYYFTDKIKKGYVLVWNMKNPKQPERKYDFNSPVMSLKFANINPNLLAVGLYNGTLLIIDISQRSMNMLAESKQFFKPIWSIMWYQMPNESDEYIMASFGNGRIIKFQLIDSQRLKYTDVMRTCRVVGEVEGIESFHICNMNKIDTTLYQQAQKLHPHPTDPQIYFITTNSGFIYACNTNYMNQYDRIVHLHQAAINTLRSNPFVKQIYLTAANDYWIRFWLEGSSKPVEEYRIAMSNVNDATWSRSHSTICITLRGNEINVWDLQRRTPFPQSQTRTPLNLLNTCIETTQLGDCIYVGDIMGNVFVYSLEDVPPKPFFQEDALKQCLYRLLVTQPDLLEDVKKI